MLEILWFALFAVDVALIVRVRRRIRVRPSTPDIELSAYEAAFLLGQQDRVIETAVAVLIKDGSLRATRADGLARVEGAQAEEPVEAAVLSGPRTPMSLRTITKACRDSEEVRSVREELAALGLCTTDRDRASVKEFYWHLLILALLWVPVTLSSTVNGPGLLVTVVLVLYAVSIYSGVSPLTKAGEDTAAGIRSGAVKVPGLADLRVADVALRGFRFYPDEEVRKAVYGGRPPSRHVRSSCGGGSSSSCSSSSCSSSSSSSCSSSSG